MICKLYSILKIVYLYTILLVKLTLWPTMCYEAFLFSPSGLTQHLTQWVTIIKIFKTELPLLH